MRHAIRSESDLFDLLLKVYANPQEIGLIRPHCTGEAYWELSSISGSYGTKLCPWRNGNQVYLLDSHCLAHFRLLVSKIEKVENDYSWDDSEIEFIFASVIPEMRIFNVATHGELRKYMPTLNSQCDIGSNRFEGVQGSSGLGLFFKEDDFAFEVRSDSLFPKFTGGHGSKHNPGSPTRMSYGLEWTIVYDYIIVRFMFDTFRLPDRDIGCIVTAGVRFEMKKPPEVVFVNYESSTSLYPTRWNDSRDGIEHHKKIGRFLKKHRSQLEEKRR